MDVARTIRHALEQLSANGSLTKAGDEYIFCSQTGHTSRASGRRLNAETLNAPRARAFEPGRARHSQTEAYGACHISRASSVALSKSTSNTVSQGASSLIRDMRCPGLAFAP